MPFNPDTCRSVHGRLLSAKFKNAQLSRPVRFYAFCKEWYRARPEHFFITGQLVMPLFISTSASGPPPPPPPRFFRNGAPPPLPFSSRPSAAAAPPQPFDGPNDSPFFCTVCNKQCGSDFSFKSHMASSAHMMRIFAAQTLAPPSRSSRTR